LIDSAEVRLPMTEVSAELAARIDREIERRISSPSFPDAQLRIVDGALD
jgi:4-hydroxy-tetrahydrodipicolinate synthase